MNETGVPNSGTAPREVDDSGWNWFTQDRIIIIACCLGGAVLILVAAIILCCVLRKPQRKLFGITYIDGWGNRVTELPPNLEDDRSDNGHVSVHETKQPTRQGSVRSTVSQSSPTAAPSQKPEVAADEDAFARRGRQSASGSRRGSVTNSRKASFVEPGVIGEL
jgi:hypothetical protein